MKLLVTGGAGYIGSHTIVELLQADHEVLVVDNLANSNEESLRRVQYVTDRSLEFYKLDLLDGVAIQLLFATHKIDAVIHFAGLKAVGESVEKPLQYYQNNIVGTVNLCEAMQERGIRNMVFSSSACVYGDPPSMPIREDFPTRPTNPYGRTKLTIEQMLIDLHGADPEMNIALLRYFNPVGAHPSGLIGENPNGIPNNLMPCIARVAAGRLPELFVYGNDYPTPDGTGVRDYIHVMDLARGHLLALEKFAEKPGLITYNLGTGQGYSVLEMVAAFAKVSGREIPYTIKERRPGDIAVCYSDTTKAYNELGWKARYGIYEICTHTWRWQSVNPEGY